MFKEAFILIGLLFYALICSCSYNGFYYENRRNYVFQEAYSNDTLVISDYILFGTYRRKRLDYGIVRLNNDSLFTVFKEAINKTELPIYFESKGRNFSNKKIIEQYHSRAKHINPEDINVYANIKDVGDSKQIIIPVIKYNYHSENDCGAAGCDRYFITHLSLSVCIFENNKIVYYKKMRYVERVDVEHIPNYNYYNHYNYYQVPISQDKWDGLVKKVMKEYIERLE